MCACGILISASAWSQVNHSPVLSDTNNIYLKCLRYHLKNVKALSKKSISSFKIEEDKYITEGLPYKIDDFSLDYLDRVHIINAITNQNSIYLITSNHETFHPINANIYFPLFLSLLEGGKK